MKITDWKEFKKGDIVNKGFRIERIQLKIDDKYFLDNFIDNLSDHLNVLNEVDRILLKLKGEPTAIFPKNDNEYFDNTVSFLETMKEDIDEIFISMMEGNNELLNTKLFDDSVNEIKLFTKIQIRYFLKED